MSAASRVSLGEMILANAKNRDMMAGLMNQLYSDELDNVQIVAKANYQSGMVIGTVLGVAMGVVASRMLGRR